LLEKCQKWGAFVKVLWIGVGIGPKLHQQLLDSGGKILSAQISESNLIQGLDAQKLSLDTLNAPNIDCRLIPKICEERWSRQGGSADYSVGYRNIEYLNRLLKQRALCKAARQWAAIYRRESKILVFVYSMHTPFIAAAWIIKKYLPQAEICLVVPDLPQYMDMNMNPIKKVFKAIDWKRICRYRMCVDKYVLYAKPMADFLKLKADQWTVMEGSYDSNYLADESNSNRPAMSKVSAMYSGVLDQRYGIPELLDAMDLLDDGYELWLTGSGNAEELIRERAARDSRIKFFGYLPSRQDLLDKQAQATMLISPRRDTEEASKYCFPSKLFEYMASGRPVISCFLAGIPDEYHAYLIELPSATSQEIAKALEKVAQMTEVEQAEFGVAAKNFVLSKKNKLAQAKRILDFVLNKEGETRSN